MRLIATRQALIMIISALVQILHCGFILLIAMGGKLSYPQVELKDKVAIVTGGNTGIGYETAKTLAIMGAHTIIACRSEERGQQVSPSLYSIIKPCIIMDVFNL